jgi:hypothetical protein
MGFGGIFFFVSFGSLCLFNILPQLKNKHGKESLKSGVESDLEKAKSIW